MAVKIPRWADPTLSANLSAIASAGENTIMSRSRPAAGGTPAHRAKLRLSQILAWADEHRRRTGRFPSRDSGVVVAKPDEKWKNLDEALRVGRRGLPGGSSLAQLLVKRRGQSRRKGMLQVSKILAWSDEHRRRAGKLPNRRSGVVAAKPDENWEDLDNCLRTGRRGLPGGSSLAKLFVKYRGYRRYVDMPRLTLEKVFKWANAHLRRTGHWPTAKSGTVSNSPGESWSRIDYAFIMGRRGLPKGRSLAKLKKKKK